MTCKPAILLALFLAAGALRAQGAVKPIWISALPQQAGRVYAMGLAPYAAGEAQAVTQAYHGGLVPPFCTAAVRGFFSQF